jgi:hypothetical protein
MIDSKELAKYLRKEMKTQGEVNTTFHLIKVPTEDDLEFWVQQFQCKDCVGHSEWSEKFQKNIWIKETK